VGCDIVQPFGEIMPSSDNFIITNYHTAYRNFLFFKGIASLLESRFHKIFVGKHISKCFSKNKDKFFKYFFWFIKDEILSLKINLLQETNKLGNFFAFLFPSFYIFAKQNQTKYERHYIRKIKGIIPEEWL